MNVQEILEIKHQRKEKNKELIDKVLENIHKRIKYYAQLNHESCTYKVSPVVGGMPLFDFQNVIISLFKKLDHEGYIVNAHEDGTIHICWNEKLVNDKAKNDSYIMKNNKIKNVTKKSKNVDNAYAFLANPKKVGKSLDDHLHSILKDRKSK
jgi:hypothetical protein